MIGDPTLLGLNSNLTVFTCVVIGELIVHRPNEPSVPDELFIIGLINVRAFGDYRHYTQTSTWRNE